MAIKILLADDSLTIQKVVELTFSDAETRLLAVGSGDRAVQALDDFQPDIVLADVVMPGLTGYDVCDVVKQRAGGMFVPVVLLTGTFEPFDRARAERVGSDAIVTKPFDSHALQGLVRDLVTRARAAREEAEVAAAAAALAPPPVPEPPPTMILSVADVEEELPPQGTAIEDTGATQAMPALVLPEAYLPPIAEDAPVPPVEDSSFRTMAMRIPSAEEFAAAATMDHVDVEPVREFTPPPPPPPPAFFEPEPLSLAPPPPSPFYRPEAALPVPLPPPAFDEPEIVPADPMPSPFDIEPAIELETPPPPAFFATDSGFVPPPPPAFPELSEPEPAFVVPPIPPPPALYEPETELEIEPAAPFESEPEKVPEPFLVEAERNEPVPPVAASEAPFEIVPEIETAPVPEEIEVELFDVAPEVAEATAAGMSAVEETTPDFLSEEPILPTAEPFAATEAVVAEEGTAEPFPEMDEIVPVAETEAAPWDEGPAVEIPPPPPEMSAGPEGSDETEPMPRDIEADLEAFEASGRVRRRPEIWERHAALIGEEAPTDIDTHGTVPEEPAALPMEDPSSSELEAMAAAARIEDLSALIPSASAPVTPAAISPAPAPEETPEAALTTAPLESVAASALSDADVDRIARRVVELLSDKAVRDIAWEVVPEYAERLVRERIAEVERAG